MRTAKIHMADGSVVLVDERDVAALSRYRWHLCNGYARRCARRTDGERQPVYMHRHLVGRSGMEVDHVNGNRLDNRRANLRVCTREENARNTGVRSSNTSGFKGVCWFGPKRLWKSEITVDRRSITLGYFRDRVHAAIAYRIAAKLLHGQFANWGKA